MCLCSVSGEALHVNQAPVLASFGHKLLVGAALHYAPLVHDADEVCAGYGAESVGYHYGGAPLHKPLQGFLHQALALGVEGGGGFVQD